MKIHTITCVSDNFTEKEIEWTEKFVRKALKPLEREIKREEGDIVLHLKSDVVAFNPVGFSAPVKSRIEQLLRKA